MNVHNATTPDEVFDYVRWFTDKSGTPSRKDYIVEHTVCRCEALKGSIDFAPINHSAISK